MFSRLTAMLGLLAVCLFSVSFAARAEMVQPSGGRMAMDAPNGFSLATDFSGLLHESGASFLFGELPGEAYAEIRQGFEDPAILARARFHNPTKLKLERSDDYFALESKMDINGTKVTRFLLLIHDAKNVGVITANIPDDAFKDGSVKRADIIKALTSTSFDSKKIDDMPFSLSDTGKFKFSESFLGSTWGFRLPEDVGKISTKFQPRFLISINPDHFGGTTDRKAAALQLLSLPNLYEKADITQSREIMIDGKKGWEFYMAYTHVNKDGTKELANTYAVILEGGDNYIWMQGYTPRDQAETFIPEFRKIFASFVSRR